MYKKLFFSCVVVASLSIIVLTLLPAHDLWFGICWVFLIPVFFESITVLLKFHQLSFVDNFFIKLMALCTAIQVVFGFHSVIDREIYHKDFHDGEGVLVLLTVLAIQAVAILIFTVVRSVFFSPKDVNRIKMSARIFYVIYLIYFIVLGNLSVHDIYAPGLDLWWACSGTAVFIFGILFIKDSNFEKIPGRL